MNKIHQLSFVVCALVLAACQGNVDNAPEPTVDTVAEPVAVQPAAADTVAPAAPSGPSYFERKAAQGAKPATKKAATTATKKTTPQPNKGKGETIYVETFGAQGKVWGHVTMYGDKGKGTIHDGDMNNFNVTVYRRTTRGREELLAIDQNSRQYVFPLR